MYKTKHKSTNYVTALVGSTKMANATATHPDDGKKMEGAGGRAVLLSPALLGLGSGRLLGGGLASFLDLLAVRTGLASGLGASAAVVEVAAVAALPWLLALAPLAPLVLLVLLAVPHRSGTGWTSGGGLTVQTMGSHY